MRCAMRCDGGVRRQRVDGADSHLAAGLHAIGIGIGIGIGISLLAKEVIAAYSIQHTAYKTERKRKSEGEKREARSEKQEARSEKQEVRSRKNVSTRASIMGHSTK